MAGSRVHFSLLALSILIAAQHSNAQQIPDQPVFTNSETCIACHSNMADADGNDVGIGHAWRGSMMALSAKDPYWMAAVRREIADRPHLQDFIEDKCSVCHMPMARTLAVSDGRSGKIFDHLEGRANPLETKLANDGVSCTVCHQISDDNFGEHSSFDGGYSINTVGSGDAPVFGPFEVDEGRHQLMQSAAAFQPMQSTHMQRSELCATCHTLFTPAVDDAGDEIGQFPEQTPYLEWQHSRFSSEQSCQDCHMPPVTAAITSVLGQAREDVNQHNFLGGNAFMLGLLDKYRDDLGVTTPAAILSRSIETTIRHLQSGTATVEVVRADLESGVGIVDINIRNFGGHKLPTAYPSRRAWLHIRISDENENLLFESGALNADGSIVGNNNDANKGEFEPHYSEINNPDQVQIFEPIIVDFSGQVTTGLLSGVRYVKDNRLLPDGFDKATAGEAIKVRGAAASDGDFVGGGDTIRYRIDVGDNVSGLKVEVRLLFQTIGYRWANNLSAYRAHEIDRFVNMYKSNADASAVVLAIATH